MCCENETAFSLDSSPRAKADTLIILAHPLAISGAEQILQSLHLCDTHMITRANATYTIPCSTLLRPTLWL